MRADCGIDGSSAFPVADLFAFRDKETKTEARYNRLTPELRGPAAGCLLENSKHTGSP
jgi:hypothetical protein